MHFGGYIEYKKITSTLIHDYEAFGGHDAHLLST